MSWADDYIDDLLDDCWQVSYTKKRKQKANTMTPNFQTGDIVRKPNGSRHIKIEQAYGNCIYGKYLHSGTSTGRIDIKNLIKVNFLINFF